MSTIKSYTDLEQSKKLAEILLLESADMWYQHTGISIKDGSEKPIYFPMVIRDCESDEDIPCWSLAALLGVLPNENMLVKTTNGEYYCLAKDVMTKHYNNSLDAAYELILKLNDLSLL